MTENILTIGEYFKKETFVVPNYQRGYKWGVPAPDGSCAVSILIDNLIQAFKTPYIDYFVQGVTVYENENKVYLVDGQQRTTTFFLLLKYLEYDFLPAIDYDIRQESDLFLKNCKVENGLLSITPLNSEDYDVQDIFYFKKAINTIHKGLALLEKKDKFRSFILENVKLFYITINEKQAPNVFSMLNGNKAFMKAEELIKAKILNQASNNMEVMIEKDPSAIEWEINALRSKYAREWDKWMYWWNNPEVIRYFKIKKNPMGLLLQIFYAIHANTNSVEYSNEPKNIASTYKAFAKTFLNGRKNAKDNFKSIRHLQKRFEDLYNNYKSYNYFGLILNSTEEKEQRTALVYFLTNEKKDINQTLKHYAKWILVGATHHQITDPQNIENKQTKESKALAVVNSLSQKVVYEIDNKNALKQLLRRNVKLDIELERKFDFEIYGQKSLEHIYPKSWENEEDTKLKFDAAGLDYQYKFKDKICLLPKDTLSVHSIGNLVLLDKNTNSEFQAEEFDAKKARYFNTTNAKWSLTLLHSVSVFCKKEWTEQSIIKNQIDFINELKTTYNVGQ